jgi:predicted lipoprotein with Yx(FWY)xxD motif
MKNRRTTDRRMEPCQAIPRHRLRRTEIMRRSTFAAAGLPLILILAACSSGAGATTAPTKPPAGSAPAASAPAASSGVGASAATSGTVDLKVAPGSGSVTNYLTAADGKTLYVFHKDTADSGKSACGAGACLDNWPPFVVSSLDEVKPDSAITGKLALITRDDGTMQVTYKGLPLYYFAGDKAAGDTNGSAIANWSVANP